MEEKIRRLYGELYSMTVGFLYYQSRDNLEEMREAVPLAEEFVLWFLEEDRCGTDAEFHRDMCRNLLGILGDIVTAMEHGDHVLLHDAAAYGLMDYLEMFVEQEEGTDDTV